MDFFAKHRSTAMSMGEQFIITTIRPFVEAEDWDAAFRYLRLHPILLEKGVDELLRMMVQSARNIDEAMWADSIEQRRKGLERCRTIGIDAACKEMKRATLLSEIQEFVSGYSWVDSYSYLLKHPRLVSDEALRELNQLEAEAKKNHPDFAKILATHRYLLRRCKEIGMKRAFIEVGGADFIRGHQSD